MFDQATNSFDTQLASCIEHKMVPATTFGPFGYTPIFATDLVDLYEQAHDWHFEFAQLTPGTFTAQGAKLQLDGVSLWRASYNRALRHRCYVQRNRAVILIPGTDSAPIFARGHLVEAGQCMTCAGGGRLEAISHGHYLDIAVGFDIHACRARLDALTGGSFRFASGATIAAPGEIWIHDMRRRIDRLFAAIAGHPDCLASEETRISLEDHLLAGMADFDNSPPDIDSSTRATRASRHAAVRLACDFIHSRLSEPLRLIDLCRLTQLRGRTLEYGFREVTGLTPLAYVRSLRLNAVRRALQQLASVRQRSISEIALESGFWHLSQFAADYRRFFGETPTQTRQRNFARPVIRGLSGSTPEHAGRQVDR